MSLQAEIDRARAEIRTDGYSMSIGEWISLYEKNELDIHPEFQRFFRWSPKQKSRLIESILLGIPIPQIFVAQRTDGVWDVVDGLQRLSTIFQFVGILKDQKGELLPALILEPTQYLPSLGGRVWEDPHNPSRAFDVTQRLLIKRSKIDVSIILKESDDKSKYELFQRLNTGGSPLSDQEVRNSILAMSNRDLYEWLRQLSLDDAFRETAALSDRAVEEQFDMELVLRFVLLRTMPRVKLKTIGDMGDFLTDRTIELAKQENFDWDAEATAFRKTFALLRDQLGSDAFRRYDAQKKRFVGGFSISAFEVIALGVGYNVARAQKDPKQVVKRAQQIWADAFFTDNSGSGVRASSRLPKIVPYGRQLFAR
jgi:hypothetical protein